MAGDSKLSQSSGGLLGTSSGSLTKAVAASVATNTVVSNGPGRLARVLITALGTNALTIHDNASAASGTIIGYIEASAAAGTIRDFEMPAANGITVAGNANNPGFTVSWD